jgi:hypothetical protein
MPVFSRCGSLIPDLFSVFHQPASGLIFKYLQISGDVNKFTFAEDEQARDKPKMRWKEVFLVRF